MSHVAFLLNCNIPQWKHIASQIDTVFSNDPHKKYLSQYAGHLPLLVKEAIDEGYTNIVVAGGDGSVNELVNGLIQANTIAGKADWGKIRNFKLGIIPMGTGNDLCKTLNISSSLKELKQLIDSNSTSCTDIGLAEFSDKKGQNCSRYFINITDVGMGGIIVENLENDNSLFSKSVRYQMQIAKTFFTYKKSLVNVVNGPIQYHGKAMNVIVANGKYFGNGLGIAPEADLQDGLLDIVILGDISIMDYLTHLGKVKKCQKLSHPEVFYHKSDEITITSADNRELPIDMDGEFVGYAPLKIINLPQRLHFYC